MQASPGQPTRAVSAQLGCQQSFPSIRDRRTPGNFTAQLLSNIYTQIPKTFLYDVLSSQRRTVHSYFKDSSLPVSPTPSREGKRWCWVRGSEGTAPTHSTHLCSYLQGLCCFLLLYLSFLQGLSTSPSIKNTPSIHMQWNSFWQLLDAIAVQQSSGFFVYVVSVTAVGLKKIYSIWVLYKHVKGLIPAPRTMQI